MLIDGANVVRGDGNGRLRELRQLVLGGGSAAGVKQRSALVRVQQQLDAFNLLLGGAAQLVAPFESLAAILVSNDGGSLRDAATLRAWPVGDGVDLVRLVGEGVCDAVADMSVNY